MAASTLAQLRTKVQERGYGTDTATAQTACLNSVYRRVAGMRRWPWLEIYQATGPAVVAGTETYNLAGTLTDLLHVEGIRLEFGTDYYNLKYVPPQEFRDAAHVYRDQGAPIYWTKVGAAQVKFYPKPDKAYTMTVDYVKFPTALAADADVHIMPENYEDVLVWGALAEMCYRERDYAGRQIAMEEYRARLMDMMNEYGLRQRQNATEVVRSGHWDQVAWPYTPWFDG